MASVTFLQSPCMLDHFLYNNQKHIDDYNITFAEQIAPTAIDLCEQLLVNKGLGDVAGLTVGHKHFDLSMSECVVMRKTGNLKEPLRNEVVDFVQHTENLLPIMAVPTIVDGLAKLNPVLFVFDYEFPEVSGMLNRLETHKNELIRTVANASEALPFALGIVLNIHPSDVRGMTLVEFTEQLSRKQRFSFEELKTNKDDAVPALYLDADSHPIPRMLPVIWKQQNGKARPQSCVTCGCCCMDGSD